MKNETTIKLTKDVSITFNSSEYECEYCEDGKNLGALLDGIEDSECFHCGNENGELKK